MAISLRATSTGPNNNATTTTINLPTGTTVGDLTIIAGSNSAGGPGNPTVTLPSGWTAVVNGPGQFTCYRLFQSGDPSSVTFTYGVAGYWQTCALSYIGCDGTTPVDTSAFCLSRNNAGVPGNSPNNAYYSAPSLCPSWTNDLLVCVFLCSSQTSAGTITLPGGLTQRVQSLNGPSVTIADSQLSSAAATGQKIATWSGSGVMQSGAALALHAAGDTPATQAPATMSIIGVWADALTTASLVGGLNWLSAQPGDLMVFAIASNTAATGVPAGWTQQLGANTTYVFTKTYQPGDANPTVPFVITGNYLAPVLFILRPCYGADTPTVDVMGTATGGATTTLPSIAPTGTNEYFLGICGQPSGTGTTWTPAVGLTRQFSNGYGPSIIIHDKQNLTAASGTFSVGSSNATTVQGFDMLVSVGAGGSGTASVQARVLVMA